MNNMLKNKSRGGKKRIEIKKIEELNRMQVTFSKRRAGVFKKASELCILTGAEAVILCESYGGRVFAFGHPTVESVVDNFIRFGSSSESLEIITPATEVHVNSPCMHEELKKQYLEISKELEVEKKKSVNVMGGKNNYNINNNNMVESDLFWWQQPFEHLDVEELEKYISSMEELMNNLTMRADDLMLIKSSSLMFDANKLYSNDDGLVQDEFFANKNLNLNDDGLLDELFAHKNSDQFFANKIENPNDDELDEIIANLEFPVDYGNNVQVSNDYGNTGNELQISQNYGILAVPGDYGNAVDLRDFDVDPNDFSFFSPPN